MRAPVLAVDFGTSNSAAAFLEAGRIRRVAVENGADTLPTAVFFPAEGAEMRIGRAAGDALVSGEDGRYMRALKSILGTSLFHETRLIEGKRRKLSDIVTAFLVALRRAAERDAGHPIRRVLSGRPVRFHSTDSARDTRAEADLRSCYHAAGFEEVAFLHEPEAAARASAATARPGELGLIVDIGGGTSDFTLFRRRETGIEILASHGIRLGGTDFDTEISMDHAMPLLGHGGQLRRSFGSGLLPMPVAIFRDLATWAKIPFLYARDTERAVEDLLAHAVEPEKVRRLRDILAERLGHDLAFAAEAGKIAANAGGGIPAIDMGFLEPGLAAPVSPASLAASLDGFRAQLRDAVAEAIDGAALAPDAVDTAILVGGSSLMALVAQAAGEVCPRAEIRHSDAFTAVIDGLALATAEDAFA